MIKTGCLVLFKLAQSCIVYVKLEQDDAGINSATWPGSIDRSLGSINQKSGQKRFFCRILTSPNS